MTNTVPDLLRDRSHGRSAAASGQRLPLSPPPSAASYWVCPTLTPLFYTDAWRELSDPQRLRYNQLTALYFAEVIAGFEAAGSSALAVLRARQNPESLLAARLTGFLKDEAGHIALWRGLIAAGEPGNLAPDPVRGFVLSVVSALVHRPGAMPLLFWLMLALEEHGVEISRRCMRMPRGELDARFFAAFRDHLRDEVRHVQLDMDLIKQFYAPLPLLRRRAIAWILRQLVSRVLLAPHKAARRVITQLVAEYPELAASKNAIRCQLKALGSNVDYQDMMYSRKSTPHLFDMFDHFPEMHAMAGVLAGYEPRKHD